MYDESIAAEDQEMFESLIEGLLENAFGTADAFLDAKTLRGLRRNLLSYYARGMMNPAGIGKNFDFHKNTEVRGDVIRWIDDETTDKFERRFLDKVQSFIAHLNSTCYCGITDYEFHYAFYGVGSFYKRHLDQFKSDKGREFSLVMYLNEDWSEAEGGNLSLYLPNKTYDLPPVEGRVVFFKSDQTEHEVHPSLVRPRLSIAGWLKTR